MKSVKLIQLNQFTIESLQDILLCEIRWPVKERIRVKVVWR